MKETRRGAWRRWLAEQFAAADPEACWEWPFHRVSNGYGQARWRGRDVQATWIAHEFAFGFPPPAGRLGCHTCDNPPCVNPNHVFFAEQKANIADMITKGRMALGRQRPIAKLSTAAIEDIRRSPLRNCDLAEQYGVDPSAISKVRNGHTWKHVAGAEE